MSNQDNLNMGQMGNVPMSNQPMQDMTQQFNPTAINPAAQNAMTYSAIYPEIYYKLKPYISMASDMVFSNGGIMPTQQELDDMTDSIYDDFVNSNPDMGDYMKKTDVDTAVPTFDGFGFRPGFRFGRFRRRGLGRDFISALLLAELLGRGGF
jgi:hypothetical protein